MALADVDPQRLVWGVEGFLRAVEAGSFGDAHVEMIEGEVRRATLGIWHGEVRESVSLELGLACRGTDWRTTSETLVLATSAPDPDVWVKRIGATPREVIGRVARYAPSDVLLVVEVGDASERGDLSQMVEVYARSRVENYWVVTRHGVFVHRGLREANYAERVLVGREGSVTVPEIGAQIEVASLIPPEG